jgi:hypothetical protein
MLAHHHGMIMKPGRNRKSRHKFIKNGNREPVSPPIYCLEDDTNGILALGAYGILSYFGEGRLP